MILLLSACSGSLSNAIFLEDADFLDALPGGEGLGVEYPGSPTPDADDASYFQTTVQTLDGLQDWSRLITTVTATVRAVPPSTRGEDYRIWGPGAWDVYPGSFLRLEMSRTSDHGLYHWTFQASEMSDDPWTEFMTGETWAEGDWDVELEWDQAALAEAIDAGGEGSLELAYAAMEEGGVIVQIDSQGYATAFEQAQSTRMWLDAPADGSGELQFAMRMDANPGELLPRDEDIELITRWDSSGTGRADGTIEGGDYPYPGLVLTQCWSEDGVLTFKADSEGVNPAEGSETDCPYMDVGVVDEL